MALRRALAQRLFNISTTSNPTLTKCRISSSSSAVQGLNPSNPDKIAPDPGDYGIFRPFNDRPPVYLRKYISVKNQMLPIGSKLIETLRSMDSSRDRIRLEGLSPPAEKSESTEGRLTVEDARKLLRFSQLETVKSKLRQIEKSYISYDEFVEICREGCSSADQGLEFAKMLDESGNVIVLGKVVFIRPEQVVKAIQALMPMPPSHPNDPRLKELEQLEQQKSAIDEKADSLVRRELWCGLGYLIIQTAAFMRLTFWELSWDVMEPICFYVTSAYFMAGYAFFLRTSREPSFEGFFQSRFSAKQRRLMKVHNFDFDRYEELRKAYCHRSPENDFPISSSFDKFGMAQIHENSFR